MASKSEEIQSQYMKYFKKNMIHLNLLTNQSIWIEELISGFQNLKSIIIWINQWI